MPPPLATSCQDIRVGPGQDREIPNGIPIPKIGNPNPEIQKFGIPIGIR